MIIDGLICLVLGFLAGYIFHGWEFDRDLAKLGQQIERLERKIKGL